jgi:putative hemolysin
MTEPTIDAVLRNLFPVAIPKPVDGALGRILGLRQAANLYRDLIAERDDRPLTDRLLSHLHVTYRVSNRDLDRIPRQGPVVIVANHPYGILDGAVLASILLRLRTDVKFLANQMLSVIPEIRDLLIPVDPIGGAVSTQMNGRGVKQALDFLSGGGLLVVFPAGEVSHFRWKERSVADPEWNPAISRVIAIACRRVRGFSVVPAYVSGSNSFLFQTLGIVHPRLRTALLVRELLNKRRRDVEVRIGHPILGERLLAIPTDAQRTQHLRWRAHLLACRNPFKARTAWSLRSRRRHDTQEPIAAAVPAEGLTREVRALGALLKSGEFEVYLAPADRIPVVLAEIGRLREVAFRAAGEGTGRASDLDAFDAHYLHLFVWNADRHEVVGAYRLGPVDSIRRRLGIGGLYTATLFDYGDEFLDRLGPALELGRSFIRPEYQRAFVPLLLLWKGIGKYIAENPRYKVLFGPVSISNQYQSVSRQLIVSFLECHSAFSEWAALVSSKNPFRPRAAKAWRGEGYATAGLDIEDLSAAVADIEPAQPGVPVLLRQYLKLGGKLLGFTVDPEFADALDGLIMVDLTKTDLKLLERYLGKVEATEFLNFHWGKYDPQQTSHTSELDAASHRGGDSAANAVLQVHRRG